MAGNTKSMGLMGRVGPRLRNAVASIFGGRETQLVGTDAANAPESPATDEVRNEPGDGGGDGGEDELSDEDTANKVPPTKGGDDPAGDDQSEASEGAVVINAKVETGREEEKTEEEEKAADPPADDPAKAAKAAKAAGTGASPAVPSAPAAAPPAKPAAAAPTAKPAAAAPAPAPAAKPDVRLTVATVISPRGCFVVKTSTEKAADKDGNMTDKAVLHLIIAKETGMVPKDQQRCYREIYAFANALEKIVPFKEDPDKYNEYTKKAAGIAQIGLMGEVALPDMALEVLEADKLLLVRTRGDKLKIDYAVSLLNICATVIVFGIFLWLGMEDGMMGNFGVKLAPFGLLIAGSALGLALSNSVRRNEYTFEDLASHNGHPSEHKVRAASVALLAIFLGLAAEILQLDIAGLNFDEIFTSGKVAVLAGAVAGLGERWMPQRILAKLTPSSTT